jgi:hypothetical protein
VACEGPGISGRRGGGGLLGTAPEASVVYILDRFIIPPRPAGDCHAELQDCQAGGTSAGDAAAYLAGQHVQPPLAVVLVAYNKTRSGVLGLRPVGTAPDGPPASPVGDRSIRGDRRTLSKTRLVNVVSLGELSFCKGTPPVNLWHFRTYIELVNVVNL